MPRRFGLPRIFAWAAVTAVLLGSPGFALAETVYADFDRDGQTDVLSTSSGSRFSLQVWLSSSQSLRELRTPRPVLRIGAFDVDGDGHPELVASDTSAGLHIWHRNKTGRVQRVRPHATQPPSIGLSNRSVTRPVTEQADIPVAGSDWVPTADTSAAALLAPPVARVFQTILGSADLADPRLRSSGSRAPPLFR